MKKLTLALLGIVFPLALLTAGCIENDGRRYGGYYYPTCQKFKTCDGCTRAYGCGWCMSGGEGLCVNDPNLCATPTTYAFSFTWEAPGCPGGGGGDGGVDYGPPVGPSNDGGTDSAPADKAPDINAGTGTDAGAD